MTDCEFYCSTRDAEFWRRLCFEDSTSAANQKRRDLQFIAPSIFQQPARVFELQRRARALSANSGLGATENGVSKPEKSERVRAIADWDPTYANERVDWYEEYVARHAPISMSWLQSPLDDYSSDTQDIKGLGLYERPDDSLVVAPLESGAVGIWNIGWQDGPRNDNWGTLVARSNAGTLSNQRDDTSASGAGSHDVQCVSVDTVRNKVYFASHSHLDEVDLETLQLTAHERYPLAISALSEATHPIPLTVATTSSLHLHDPRSPRNFRSSQSEKDGQVESNTASLPTISPRYPHRGPCDTDGRHANLFDTGPLSILHLPSSNGQHDAANGHICVAGRFPSILTYDRRAFPTLRSTVHSGARLASMTSLPYPLLYSHSNPPVDAAASHTLIACGEYNGKGSLELYPFSTSGFTNPPSSSSSSSYPAETPAAPVIPYKNRTSASSSKLLSVAPHGTRIVFSDGDGGLKWVERDGHSLVRRWNINAYTASASKSFLGADNRTPRGIFAESTNDGGNVARKILPVGSWEDGKGELAVWTGEKVGILGFRPKPRFEWEQQERGREADDEDGEEVYAGRMRRALERQADEARFVQGLGLAG